MIWRKISQRMMIMKETILMIVKVSQQHLLGQHKKDRVNLA